MNNPVMAMIWQCWRMSRRWYLLALVGSIYLGWMIFYASSPPVFIDPHDFILMQANGVFPVIAGIACFSTLLTISVGNKSGFPFSFEFRMPVSTFKLVTVPMLFLGVLFASLYVIPLGLYGLLLDIPFPMIPGATLIIAMTVLLLCCCWTTSSNGLRGVAVIFAVIFSMLIFYWFNPLNIIFQWDRNSGKPPFNPDIIALDGYEYLVLIVSTVMFLCVSILLIENLRRGKLAWLYSGEDAFLGRNPANDNKFFSLGALRETLSDKMSFACPATRAWQAEIWCEFIRYVIPVLLLSATIAVVIPCLTLFGAATDWPFVVDITAAGPLVVFFAGIGLSLFKRRQDRGGYLDVFEGSRAMSTLQLAGIQILTIAIATAVGIVLVESSLGLSQSFPGNLRDPLFNPGSLLAPNAEMTFLAVLTNWVIWVVFYIGLIAMFTCFHSCAVFWGRKFLAVTVLLAWNALIFTVRITQGELVLQIIIILMWCFSIAVGLATLFSLNHIFRLKVVSDRAGFFLLLGWLGFAVCGYFNLEQRGYDFSHMDAEFLAFNMALLVLPLTLAALTLWCYDRLRHT